MKLEDQSSSSSNDDMLSQTQDPLERRRLQNRLSQRNHRRKIRERIAKLQERVIANELRAAAALHGWDQGYNAAYSTSTYPPRPFSGCTDQYFGFPSRDTSSIGPEQTATPMPHCAPYPTQSWPTDPNTFQLPQTHTGDSSYFGEMNNLTPVATPSGLASSINTSIPNNGLAGDAFHETERASERQLQEDLSQSMSPPSFYVVTEAALPQVLQVINTMSPQSKVIVLVPPESSNSVSSSMPIFPPSPSYGQNFNIPVTDTVPLHNPQNVSCLCHTHNALNGSPAELARVTMGPAAYAQKCPLHKVVPSSLTNGVNSSRLM
ncbi:unnamed protein product [Penicillium olsonii]|nr:unnamed protein product [Penicillium olsonii]